MCFTPMHECPSAALSTVIQLCKRMFTEFSIYSILIFKQQNEILNFKIIKQIFTRGNKYTDKYL